MEVRRLAPADLSACYAHRLRALEQAPTAFLTTLAEQQARGPERFRDVLVNGGEDAVIFGAVEGAMVVGMVGLMREQRDKLSHRADIWGMYVDVEFRRRGIGGQLVDAALAHARRLPNLAVIYLSVEAGNEPARRLYESRGFRAWGTEPRAMHDGGVFYDETHMSLLLG